MLVFVPGTDETMHLLHKDHLYHKIDKTTTYRCVKRGCNAKVTVNDECVQECSSVKHINENCEMNQCQIDVKNELKQMKINAETQLDCPPKTVHTNSRKALTDKGHLEDNLKIYIKPRFHFMLLVVAQ